MRASSCHSYFIRLYEGACMPLFGGPSFCLYHEGSYRQEYCCMVLYEAFCSSHCFSEKKDVDNNKDKEKYKQEPKCARKTRHMQTVVSKCRSHYFLFIDEGSYRSM